jgi:hypothetical protein
MAFISIKKGIVGKSLNGKGFIVIDRYTNKSGEVIDTEYAVWTELTFAEGSVVNVSGGYSDKIDDYSGTSKISRSIRGYKIEVAADDTPF